jgi:hypothetical protein
MEDVSSMELNLLANTNQKVPFYDFRLSANSVPWMDETLNFCDSTFYSDWLDFNISMTASGNHFSDLVVTRYLNGGFRLGRSSAYRKRAYDPVRLDEFMGKGNINISGDFNAYSQEIYFRNLEVKGNGFSFLGYGNSTRNDQSFYFSGSNQNKYLSLNLNYNGEVCQKKK